MKNVISLLGIVALVGLMAWAQDPSTPTLTEVESLKIQNLTKDLQLIQVQLQLLREQANQLQTQYGTDQSAIHALVDKVFVDHKLSKDDWTFDQDTLKFTKKPVPARDKK